RLLSAIRGLVDDLRDGSDVALGVATPGIVDPAGRRTLYCPGKLDIEGVDWQEALRWDGPVPVLNDANAALLGECWTGAGRGLSHVVLLTSSEEHTSELQSRDTLVCCLLLANTNTDVFT